VNLPLQLPCLRTHITAPLTMGTWDLCRHRSRVVVRRVIAWLIPRTQDSQLLALDALFASHAALTWCNILPALFLSLCPVAVFRVPGTNMVKKVFPFGWDRRITAYMDEHFMLLADGRSAAPCSFHSLFLFSWRARTLHEAR